MAALTPEEMKSIAEAPVLTGLAVSMIDVGVISTLPEAAALSKEIAGVAKKYPSNTVVQAIFSDEALKSGAVKLDKPNIKAEDVQSGAIVDHAVTAIRAALGILSGKATAEEITEYKTFIYSCAESVANAAGSGLFGSGAKVSEKEAAALEKIKAALV